jgi:ABC-type sugar transport system ATPase subunit
MPAPNPSASAGPLLAVRDVAVRFGGIVALDGISFELPEGQILGLIGPNGAGKTTLFNCLSRLYTPSSGDILFEGRSILGRSAHRIAEIGIGRTFQNVALFPHLSVLDNIMIGAHSRSRSDFVSDTLTSNCAAWPTSPWPACPSGRRSGSSSPARWQAARSCSSSTSRPAASTTTRSKAWAASSAASATSAASPCSSWSTT